MPTFEELYAFLKAHYRPSRFELNADKDKAKRICQMYLDDLEKYGCSHLSRHEDVGSKGFKFDRNLLIYYGKDVEYPNNAGNLTHLF
ncbi:TPA: hypothetical protein ACPZLH_001536 [Yersinia enterocolitica]